VRERRGPFAAPHPLGFDHDVAPRGEDQRPGELCRRDRRGGRAGAYRDAELGARGEVDVVGTAADLADQPEPRQTLEQGAREGASLAHRHHGVGIAH
jgi:hypothetical protein